MSKAIDFHLKCYPIAHTPNDDMILITVLMKRGKGTFTALAALVPNDLLADPEYCSVRKWVSVNGNPLREDEAALIWPDVKGSYAI